MTTDRDGIEAGIPVSTPYIVISIRDPHQPKARVRKQSGLCGVLHLAFHDAEPIATMVLPKTIVFMSAKQAKRIWAFVHEHEAQVGTIVVNCQQGVSRSPAVAAALCKAMGGNDRMFWDEFNPNRYVYQLVLDACPKAGCGSAERT